MFLEKLDEDTVYEVLVSTRNDAGEYNIKAFGMKIMEDNIVLKLYPNRTLFNIRLNNSFALHFTSDILMYTGAVMGLLDETSLAHMDCSVCCDVTDFQISKINDDIGKNTITTITAKPSKIIENGMTLPVINRSTNKIIELLVDYSRYEFMDMDARSNFQKKVFDTEKFIQKNGNEKHRKSLKIIKERISLHD